MIFRFGRVLAGLFVVLCAWQGGVSHSAPAPERFIHLRNERISPGIVKVETMLSPANDLILIQFTGSPTRQWLDILRTQGVEALRYVPDDTFIARVNGARPGDLRRLPFVRWVGRYRPEHKLQASLQDQHPVNPTASVEVAVLLAQGAPDGEVRDLKRLFENLRHETAGRVGTILRGQLGRGQLRKAAESPRRVSLGYLGLCRHGRRCKRCGGGHLKYDRTRCCHNAFGGGKARCGDQRSHFLAARRRAGRLFITCRYNATPIRARHSH